MLFGGATTGPAENSLNCYATQFFDRLRSPKTTEERRFCGRCTGHRRGKRIPACVVIWGTPTSLCLLPNKSVILTTNLKDIEPLANALGKEG